MAWESRSRQSPPSFITYGCKFRKLVLVLIEYDHDKNAFSVTSVSIRSVTCLNDAKTQNHEASAQYEFNQKHKAITLAWELSAHLISTVVLYKWLQNVSGSYQSLQWRAGTRWDHENPATYKSWDVTKANSNISPLTAGLRNHTAELCYAKRPARTDYSTHCPDYQA